MENLRRLGGEAGVLAGIALAWVILGFVVLFPSAGLTLIDQANPHRYLPFIARHPVMFWMVNILGGLVAAFMSAVVFMALQDRFQEDAPASARIGSLAGIMGATAFAAGAVVRHVGFGTLAPMYTANVVGASHAFYAVNGMASSLAALGNLAAGLGILAVGPLMFKHRKYTGVGYLSVAAGVAIVLSGFVIHPFTVIASAAAAAAWLTWTALVLRKESGPALVRWGATKSRANSRAQRRVA